MSLEVVDSQNCGRLLSSQLWGMGTRTRLCVNAVREQSRLGRTRPRGYEKEEKNTLDKKTKMKKAAPNMAQGCLHCLKAVGGNSFTSASKKNPRGLGRWENVKRLPPGEELECPGAGFELRYLL